MEQQKMRYVWLSTCILLFCIGSWKDSQVKKNLIQWAIWDHGPSQSGLHSRHCDSVGRFNGKGKCSYFDAWIKSVGKDPITQHFIGLVNIPQRADVNMPPIRKLVVHMHSGNVRDLNLVLWTNDVSKNSYHSLSVMSVELHQAPMLSTCIFWEQHTIVVIYWYNVAIMFPRQILHCSCTFRETRYSSQIAYRIKFLSPWVYQ